MTTPSGPPTGREGGLLRLQCPHCGAEYPLWFRPDLSADDTLTRTEWEMWLDRECPECGKTPRTAVSP